MFSFRLIMRANRLRNLLAISRLSGDFRRPKRSKNNLTGSTLGVRPILGITFYTLHLLS